MVCRSVCLSVCRSVTLVSQTNRGVISVEDSGGPKDTYFTVPRSVEGWVDLETAGRLYMSVAVMINTASHTAVSHGTSATCRGTWVWTTCLRCGGWELNSQPWSCKSYTLTTRLPSHSDHFCCSISVTCCLNWVGVYTTLMTVFYISLQRNWSVVCHVYMIAQVCACMRTYRIHIINPSHLLLFFPFSPLLIVLLSFISLE